MVMVTATDGTQLAVADAGDGPTIVLLHGVTEDHRTFDPLVGRFVDAGYRVVAPDQRGHGESDRNPPYRLGTFTSDLDEVVAQLDVDQPLVIGHGMGAAIGGAHVAGGDARAMVNIEGELRLGAFVRSMRTVVATLQQDPHLGRSAVDAVYGPMLGLLSDEERDRLTGLREVDPEVMIAMWQPILAMVEAELNETMAMLASVVTVPYLFVHGNDPGGEYLVGISKLLPWAEIEVWPGHGHYPHLVDPDRFVRTVVDFDPAR